MIGINYKDNFSRVFDYSGDVETFVIPKNATMLHIWAIGAGGNGGAGFSRAAGNPGGGGGGGAAGAIVTMLIPTRFLPPTLYIQIGKGGGGNTTDSGYTKVMFRRGDPGASLIVADSLLLANCGLNGGNGSAAAVGSAGTGQNYSLNNNAFAGLGTLTITSSQTGVTGGTPSGSVGSNGGGATFPSPFTNGAGGAGCTTTDYAGGNIVPNQNAQLYTGFTRLGGQNAGDNGLDGLFFEEPLVGYGGSGGASNNSGVGGKGGNAAIGCGGGGGGAGVTGGTGGTGGNGRAIITWF
jgi:hypothetical protein